MENRSREATTEYWGWQMEAACKGKGSSLFYHPEGERGAEKASRITPLKKYVSIV